MNTDNLKAALAGRRLTKAEKRIQRRGDRRFAQEFSPQSTTYDAVRGEVSVGIVGGGTVPTRIISTGSKIRAAVFPLGGISGSSDAKPI